MFTDVMGALCTGQCAGHKICAPGTCPGHEFCALLYIVHPSSAGHISLFLSDFGITAIRIELEDFYVD